MDKYHIYEEVGTGAHSQVFKGREKMGIEYVAIKRVDKSMMESVVNEVQVTYRLESPNVLKFHDWYETRNNVWLILEFCTGGDLRTLITQDHREPESAVRLFGVDLLAGLQQTHAGGFLHGDLRPSNVLIDEYGILKLSGFGLARDVASVSAGARENEGVNVGMQQQRAQEQHKLKKQRAECCEAGEGAGSGRAPAYMAPELFSEGEDALSFASDFWSLGCVLFELRTGEPPFGTSSSASVAERIMREDPPGLENGEWQGARMTPQFRALVGWLLQKDPTRRPTWPQLLAHPFWNNCQTPLLLEMPAQPRFDRAAAMVDRARQASGSGFGPDFSGSMDPRDAADAERTDDGERERRSLKSESGATSPEGGARRVRPKDRSIAREDPKRPPSPRGGHGKGVGMGAYGTERKADAHCGPDRAREAASHTKASGKIVETRDGERPITAPLASPRTLCGRRSHGEQRERFRRASSNHDRGDRNSCVGGIVTPSNETWRGAKEGEHSLHSLPPPVAPFAPKVSPGEKQCRCIGKAATSVEPCNSTAAGDGAKKFTGAEVADRVAALKDLRLYGRNLTGTGGRTSPSVMSAVSAASLASSSSFGEKYGSSFEEDTEGSSSYSATGGGRRGGVDAIVRGIGSEASAIVAYMTADVAGKGHSVVTPGSVRTASTASPSTGRASGARGGVSSSSGAGRTDRARAALGRDSETVGAADGKSSASTITMGDIPGGWRRRRRRQRLPVDEGSPSTSPSASATSAGSGDESGSASRPGSSSLDFPSSGSWSGSHGLSDTALSFGKSAGSPAHERISNSSRKQSPSVACNVRALTEIAASGGGVLGSAEAEQEREKARRGAMRVGVPKEAVQTQAAGDKREVAWRESRGATASVIFADGTGGVGERTRLSPDRGRGQPGRHGMDATRPEREGAYDRCGSVAWSRDTLELLLHTSDAQVTPIVGSKSAELASARQRGAQHSRSQLPFGALLPTVASAMPAAALEAHLTAAYGALADASAPAWQRGQTLIYLQSLASVPRVANLLINSTFLVLLLRILRKPRPARIRNAVAILIGLLVRHATYIAPEAGSVNDQHSYEATSEKCGEGREAGDGDDCGDRATGGGGLMSALMATARRPALGGATQTTALRSNTVAALGELLFYVVTQEPRAPDSAKGDDGVGGHPCVVGVAEGGGRRAWSVPTAAVESVIKECLEDTQHEDVRHSAAKTVENVLALAGLSHPLARILATLEFALRLLDLAGHAHSENVRGTAASALSHLLGHDILDDTDTGGHPEGGAGATGRRLQDKRIFERRGKNNDRRKGECRYALHGGWIASRVMCTPGAVAVMLQGLSEGSSPVCRRAFLNILNLLFWGAARSRASAGVWRHHPLGRAAENVLESQHAILPRLLRIAEHGQGAILRAKGFLALRLTLEIAAPSVLLKACRSRLLPLLARVIGALDSRIDGGGGGNAGVPGLSSQEEYLYECGIELADWLCTVPERAARTLLEELRGTCSPGVQGSQRCGKDRRRRSRQSTGETRSTALEAAIGPFPAVAHLVNSPLLRARAVTNALVRDLSACLALSCPVDARSAAVAIDVESDGGGASAALAAILPTIEALAQQAEVSLLPHREAVSSELVPVLCRLLRSTSGDTRALALAVLRVLLPPLLRPAVSYSGHAHDRWIGPFAGPSSFEPAVLDDAEASPVRAHAAIAESLLPLVAALLNDDVPIPQFTVRLLLDVAREWRGLGSALLEQKDSISALLSRLPMPLPPPNSSPLVIPRSPLAVDRDFPLRSNQPQSVLRHRGMEQRDATAAALDPAIAALFTLFVERCDSDVWGFSKTGGADSTVAVVLRSELPGRVAAAVMDSVAAELPEAVEAFLGLAAALVQAALVNRRDDTQLEKLMDGVDLSPSEAYLWRPPSVAGGQMSGGERGVSAMRWEAELEPLLATVPTALEGMRLFCVRGGVAEGREKLGKKSREVFVDDGVRSGIADVATLFLEVCHQFFRDRLLRSLSCSAYGTAGDAPPRPTTSSAPSTTAMICRHVAEVLGSHNQDERPRVRLLRILFAAASARGRPLGRALGQGPLWAVLLRLATGRAGVDKAVGTNGRATNEAAPMAWGNEVLGPTQALARDIVAAVKRMDRVDSRGVALEARRGRDGQW